MQTQWLRVAASRIRGKEPGPGKALAASAASCQSWSEAEVGAWLGELGLGEHRAAFEEHRIDGYALLRLERSDMREMGLSKIGDLKRLQGGIADLNRALLKAHEPTSSSGLQ